MCTIGGAHKHLRTAILSTFDILGFAIGNLDFLILGKLTKSPIGLWATSDACKFAMVHVCFPALSLTPQLDSAWWLLQSLRTTWMAIPYGFWSHTLWSLTHHVDPQLAINWPSSNTKTPQLNTNNPSSTWWPCLTSFVHHNWGLSISSARRHKGRYHGPMPWWRVSSFRPCWRRTELCKKCSSFLPFSPRYSRSDVQCNNLIHLAADNQLAVANDSYPMVYPAMGDHGALDFPTWSTTTYWYCFINLDLFNQPG